ncbi:MAG: DUF3892 domain-containing protein, partial [Candidatus Delongbacteria bacterium]|nr:DUF3892 domain-containing protein [Candidatus Delongbacteria bacterium]
MYNNIPDYIIVEKETADDKKTIKRVRIGKITNNSLINFDILDKQVVIELLNKYLIYTALKIENNPDLKEDMLEYWNIKEEVLAVPEDNPAYIRTVSNGILEDNLENLPP